MYCRDCGHADHFVLFVELSVTLHADGERSDPGGTFGLQCPRCAGTDVRGWLGRLVRDIARVPVDTA